MEQFMNYRGIRTSSSPDTSKDGDLSVCQNLEVYNGVLRPSVIKGTEPIKINTSGYTLLYVHHLNNSDVNYIFYDDEPLFYTNRENNLIPFSNIPAVKQVTSIGNTLIIIDREGHINYFLWGEVDESGIKSYKDLGATIPDVAINFSLESSLGKISRFDIDFNPEEWRGKDFNDETKTKVTNTVMAQVNKYIKENATDKGKFIYPFFVRYALRLFDGTLTKHSAPILMIATSGESPVVTKMQNESWSIYGLMHNLCMLASSVNPQLDQWHDIVKSVDIFISQPIYTIDISGECKRLGESPSQFTISKLLYDKDVFPDSVPSPIPQYPFFQHHILFDAFKLLRPQQNFPFEYFVELPQKEDKEIKIEDVSTFHFLKSIDIKQLSQYKEWKKIEIEGDYLQSIEQKEIMTDDYDYNNIKRADKAFVYNNRLNISGVISELFNGYKVPFQKSNGYISYFMDDVQRNNYAVTIFVDIKRDGQIYRVKESAGVFAYGSFPYFFYYPDPNASKVTIMRQYTESGIFKTDFLELPLQKHKFLNGAYFFNNFFEYWDYKTSEEPAITDENIYMPNKIYTSEIGNPFFFPLGGINTIGTGKIQGMSAITRALSQGQFGQFPLLVFSTDGIWALEVSSNGLYSSKQKMSNHICSNTESITQIDGAVLFISSKGLIIIEGGDVYSLSDDVEGCMDDLSFIGINTISLIGRMQKSMIAYDYPNSRVVIFDSSNEVIIYHLVSKTWNTILLDTPIKKAISDYPYNFIQTDKIIRMDKQYECSGEKTNGLIVTRPLKFESLSFKTISQIIHQGNLRTSPETKIYGSYDCINWSYVGDFKSNRASRIPVSFKYYRLVIKTSIDSHEKLSGIRFEIMEKFKNRFR